MSSARRSSDEHLGASIGGFRIPAVPGELTAESSLVRVVRRVLDGARSGRLPLFAWTFGLSQPEWRAMIAACFPGAEAGDPLTPEAFAGIGSQAPFGFAALVALIVGYAGVAGDATRKPWRGPGGAPPRPSVWLAHAIAAACQGGQHLWQDLGLSGRDEVSGLLSTHFPSLFRANTGNLKWKRFLFDELSRRDPRFEGFRPNCEGCGDYPRCFPGGTGRNETA